MFKGMICFWGAHYFSYFKVLTDDCEEMWVRFDDKYLTKKESWKQIVLENSENQICPTTLIFERVIDIEEDLEGKA